MFWASILFGFCGLLAGIQAAGASCLSDPSSRCARDWSLAPGDKCVHIPKRKQNFRKAAALCASNGGKLLENMELDSSPSVKQCLLAKHPNKKVKVVWIKKTGLPNRKCAIYNLVSGSIRSLGCGKKRFYACQKDALPSPETTTELPTTTPEQTTATSTISSATMRRTREPTTTTTEAITDGPSTSRTTTPSAPRLSSSEFTTDNMRFRTDFGTRSTSSYFTTESRPRSTTTFSTTEGRPRSTTTFSTTEGRPRSTTTFSTTEGRPRSTTTFSTTEGRPRSTTTDSTTEGRPRSPTAYFTTEGRPRSTATDSTTEGRPRSTTTDSTTEDRPRSTTTYSTTESDVVARSTSTKDYEYRSTTTYPDRDTTTGYLVNTVDDTTTGSAYSTTVGGIKSTQSYPMEVSTTVSYNTDSTTKPEIRYSPYKSDSTTDSGIKYPSFNTDSTTKSNTRSPNYSTDSTTDSNMRYTTDNIESTTFPGVRLIPDSTTSTMGPEYTSSINEVTTAYMPYDTNTSMANDTKDGHTDFTTSGSNNDNNNTSTRQVSSTTRADAAVSKTTISPVTVPTEGVTDMRGEPARLPRPDSSLPQCRLPRKLPTCPQNWSPYGPSLCLYVNLETRGSHHEATYECIDQGGSLVSEADLSDNIKICLAEGYANMSVARSTVRIAGGKCLTLITGDVTICASDHNLGHICAIDHEPKAGETMMGAAPVAGMTIAATSVAILVYHTLKARMSS